MEPEQTSDSLVKQLLQMQFPDTLVHQAVQFTNDKQKAILYIVEALQDMEKFGIKQNEGTKEQQDNSEDYEDCEQQSCKMVFLVRMDLKMGLGKMAAQVGHATLGAYKKIYSLSQSNQDAELLLLDWMQNGSKKITLKVWSEQQIHEIVQKAKAKNINYYVVHDAGKTQIAAGSLTVCGLGPQRDQVLDSVTGHLKLL